MEPPDCALAGIIVTWMKALPSTRYSWLMVRSRLTKDRVGSPVSAVAPDGPLKTTTGEPGLVTSVSLSDDSADVVVRKRVGVVGLVPPGLGVRKWYRPCELVLTGATRTRPFSPRPFVPPLS